MPGSQLSLLEAAISTAMLGSQGAAPSPIGNRKTGILGLVTQNCTFPQPTPQLTPRSTAATAPTGLLVSHALQCCLLSPPPPLPTL